MRVILTTEDDGFLLIPLDLALLDEFFFLSPNTLQKNGSRLISWILWHKLATDGKVKYLGLSFRNKSQDIRLSNLNAIYNIHQLIKVLDKSILFRTWRKWNKRISDDSLVNFWHTASASSCVLYVISSDELRFKHTIHIFYINAFHQMNSHHQIGINKSAIFAFIYAARSNQLS